MQQQQIIHFSINLWHTTKSGFYMQLGEDQLCGWTEKRLQSLPKAKNFHQKKVMVVAWWSAACLIHYSFLNPGKTLHLRSALSKLRCTENWHSSSGHWSTIWAQLFSTRTPDRTAHNQCCESWMNWIRKFCLIHCNHLTSYQPTTTSWSISTTFCRENASTNYQAAENAFQEFIESQSTNCYATGVNKHIPINILP